MGISVSVQTLEFLYAALFGVALGILYDIFAIIRSYLPKNRLITALLDILFWIIACASLLAFVMLVSEGRMRWYVLVGAFLGIFLYKCTISALFFRAVRIIISISVKILKLLVSPLYLLSDWLYRTALSTYHGAQSAARKKRVKAKQKHEQKKKEQAKIMQKKKERKQKRRSVKRGNKKKEA